ncbi:hypothetical protein [Streptomyces sp. NPDC046862]|uniref:hypothetical protein n=1 Tax=Streptomyces sp. NPDC046862 TaxID=3154603 RepID=UPI003455C0BF
MGRRDTPWWTIQLGLRPLDDREQLLCRGGEMLRVLGEPDTASLPLQQGGRVGQGHDGGDGGDGGGERVGQGLRVAGCRGHEGSLSAA